MSAHDLRDEAGYELSQMRIAVAELEALRRDVGEHEPTLREVMAAGAFLSSFYNGVENILKRVSKHYGVPLPTSDQWHVALLDGFREPPTTGCRCSCPSRWLYIVGFVTSLAPATA